MRICEVTYRLMDDAGKFHRTTYGVADDFALDAEAITCETFFEIEKGNGTSIWVDARSILSVNVYDEAPPNA